MSEPEYGPLIRFLRSAVKIALGFSVTFRQIVIAPKPTLAAKNLARAKAESILAEIRKTIKRGGSKKRSAPKA